MTSLALRIHRLFVSSTATTLVIAALTLPALVLASLPMPVLARSPASTPDGAAGFVIDLRPELRGDAQPLRAMRIATLNAEHWMSKARFEQWLAWCASHGWTDLQAPGEAKPEGLTYCDALSGLDRSGRRTSAPVRDQEAWTAKRDALRSMLDRADADLVLLQEVSDAQAVRELLGPGYAIATTAELWADARIAQNVALAWRRSLPVLEGPTVLSALSVRDPDGHRTRPGLWLSLRVGRNRVLSVLNVHLKAGCRLGRMDEATSPEPSMQQRRMLACSLLQAQVPVLQDWIDSHLHRADELIVAGDFNRDLVRELRERMPASADGRTVGLFAKLTDGEPRTADLELVFGNGYPGDAACHRHIDGFLVTGRGLANRAQANGAQANDEASGPRKSRTRTRATVIADPQPPATDRVRASDHCLHLMTLDRLDGRG